MQVFQPVQGGIELPKRSVPFAQPGLTCVHHCCLVGSQSRECVLVPADSSSPCMPRRLRITLIFMQQAVA